MVHFNWKLIEKDEYDNKFIDAFVASGADWLISNDSTVINLNNNNFPPLNILTLEEFSNLLKTQI